MSTQKNQYKKKSFAFPIELYKKLEAAAKKDQRNVHNYIILFLKNTHK